MDAVKFIEELNRMCKSFGDRCTGCPALKACENVLCCVVSKESTLDATAQIAIVEEWSAAHPRKTRQSVFMEQYPNARPADDGMLTFCPKRFDFHISCLAECHSLKKCSDCRREFWMQEVE